MAAPRSSGVTNLSGSDSIIGRASLTKSNTGTLTISALNNSYTGKTIIAGGTVVVSELDAVGYPSPLGSPPGGSTGSGGLAGGPAGTSGQAGASGAGGTAGATGLAGTAGGGRGGATGGGGRGGTTGGAGTTGGGSGGSGGTTGGGGAGGAGGKKFVGSCLLGTMGTPSGVCFDLYDLSMSDALQICMDGFGGTWLGSARCSTTGTDHCCTTADNVDACYYIPGECL